MREAASAPLPRPLSQIPTYTIRLEGHGSPGFQTWAELAARRHGKTVRVVLPNGSEILLLSDRRHNDVFRRNPAAFRKEVEQLPSTAAVVALLLKDSVTSTPEGPLWKERRSQSMPLMRITQPSFSSALVSASDALLDDLLRHGGRDPLWETCAIWAARAVSKPMLGHEIEDEQTLEVVDGLVKTMFKLTLHAEEERDITVLREDPGVVHMRDLTVALVDRAVRTRKANEESMVSAVAESVGEGLTDSELVQLLVPIVSGNLVASIHTTALTLMWTLFQLAGAPEVAADIHAESRRHAESPSARSRDWRMDDFPKAQAAVRESLRITPIVPFIERVVSEPVDFGDVEVPAGTTVMFAPWLIHRDPQIWPEPLAFRPERFLGNGKLDHNAYFPFGLGPRGCIGMNFALPQLTFAISRICGRMTLERAPDCKPVAWKPVQRILLEPRAPVSIQCRVREREPLDA
jgi:cytochrome P450